MKSETLETLAAENQRLREGIMRFLIPHCRHIAETWTDFLMELGGIEQDGCGQFRLTPLPTEPATNDPLENWICHMCGWKGLELTYLEVEPAHKRYHSKQGTKCDCVVMHIYPSRFGQPSPAPQPDTQEKCGHPVFDDGKCTLCGILEPDTQDEKLPTVQAVQQSIIDMQGVLHAHVKPVKPCPPHDFGDLSKPCRRCGVTWEQYQQQGLNNLTPGFAGGYAAILNAQSEQGQATPEQSSALEPLTYLTAWMQCNGVVEKRERELCRKLWVVMEKNLIALTAELAALRSKAEWVKCSERMPGRTENVLLFIPHLDPPIAFELYYFEAGIWQTALKGEPIWECLTPTHWMNLPNPPPTFSKSTS